MIRRRRCPVPSYKRIGSEQNIMLMVSSIIRAASSILSAVRSLMSSALLFLCLQTGLLSLFFYSQTVFSPNIP